ncbi:BamA/TamA family outer membrane protein [Candidatus Babeliales bacterium]|nr:BamA/TamA family outer membrane protein [Candidatus Babeliales bacterium]
MLRFVHAIVSLYICCLCLGVYAHQSSATFVFQDLESARTTITALFPVPVRLAGKIYEECGGVSKDELEYLIDLDPGDEITSDTVYKALTYLAKKTVFHSVNLSRYDRGDGTVDLIWRFNRAWTFRRLKILGVRRERDSYRQYYLLEPGEPFDAIKHRHSVEILRDALKKEGYLQAQVTPTLIRDYQAKSLDVHLKLHRGNVFRIRPVRVAVQQGSLAREEHAELTAAVASVAYHNLRDKRYTQDVLDKCGSKINALLLKRGFLQSSISLKEEIDFDTESVGLVVEIDPHTKREFVFFGNHFFSDTQLLDELLQFGQSIWLIPLTLLKEEIMRSYHKKGFWNCKVEAYEDYGTFFFVITEGPRARITSIAVHGIQVCDSSQIIARFFTPRLHGVPYDATEIQASLDALAQWYKTEGLWDMQVVHHECLCIHEDEYEVLIHIDEGKRRYLRSVTIPDYPELESKTLFISNTDEPMPFDAFLIARQRRWLLQYLQEHGYLYSDVSYELLSDVADSCVLDVVWHVIKQVDKVTFGKTVISGASSYAFAKVMRELEYKQGDTWNKDALSRSLTNLRSLGVFESAHLYPYDIGDPEPSKPLLLRLVDDDPFEVRLRAGVLGVSKNFSYRDGATYVCGGSFVYKNPFGDGGRLQFDGDVTRFERRITGWYEVPWFMNRRIKTRLKGYSNKYEQPLFIGSKDTLYTVGQHGVLWNACVSRNTMTGALTAGTEWMRTNELNTQVAEAIDFEPDLIDIMVPYLFIEPSLVMDALDNTLNPKRGSFTVISLKAMFPVRDDVSYFVRMLLEQSFFRSIGPIVAGMRIRMGHIFNQVFSQIMPTERFYLGGAYSLRGYQPDFAPPLGTYCRDGQVEFAPQGGKSMLNINAELRFPVYGNIGGTVFQDAGVLVGDSLEHAHDEAVAATGIGIRYDTPIGPFRLDVGLRWRSKVEDLFKVAERDVARTTWFFTLGNAF